MQLPSAQNLLLILERLLLNFQYMWGPKTRKEMSVTLGGGLFLAVVCGRTAGGRWRVTDRFIVELQELGLAGLPLASLTAPSTRPVTLRQWTSPGCETDLPAVCASPRGVVPLPRAQHIWQSNTQSCRSVVEARKLHARWQEHLQAWTHRKMHVTYAKAHTNSHILYLSKQRERAV